MTAFPFVGGSYTARSPTFDAQRTVNLYPEVSGSGTSKTVGMLIGTPGLKLWSTISDVPIRGLLRVSATVGIVVAGSHVFVVDTAGASTQIGSIAPGMSPVSMASNGLSVMLVTGANGYFINLKTYLVSPISDAAFTGADKVDFLDGFFVFNQPGTQNFQITTLYGTAIQPLDFASAEGSPDVLISLIVDHREAWMFGLNSTEVFVNTGAADFPFERLQGVFIEQGCAAKNSVVKMDNTIIWLSADDRGQGIVQRARGYVPDRISNHALEFAIASYSRIDDAVAYSYQQEGHMFYMLTFPSAKATWCFDSTTALWHQRAWRNTSSGALEQHRSICHMAFANKNIVGDWETGKLYYFDLDTYTDNGDTIPAIRQCPHIAEQNGVWQFFASLWVDMQTGVGLSSGQGSDPVVMLEWSDDGGRSFPHYQTVKIGKIGETRMRARWNRLGRSRDRVWRVTLSDPIKRIFLDGDVMYSVGTT